MSVPPSDAVNLVSASLLLEDFFAAIYAYFSTTSTRWTAGLETSVTAAPKPGSFSFVISSISDDFELCFVNEGTPAAPDILDGRVGINPDGSVDPILDDTDPSASAANYSGLNGSAYENGVLAFRWSDLSVAFKPDNTEFSLIEYDDAIILLFKNGTRTIFPRGLYAGNILAPAFTGWNVPPLFVDGFGILSDVVGLKISAVPAEQPFWLNGNTAAGSVTTVNSVMRSQLGQLIGNATVNPPPVPWMGKPNVDTPKQTGWTALELSIGGLLSPGAVQMRIGASLPLGYLKHLRILPDEPPYTKWQAGGADVYMTLGNGNTVAAGPLACVIPDGFAPR